MNRELSGRSLRLACAAWLAFAVPLAGLNIVSLAAAFRLSQHSAFTVAQLQGYAALGLSASGAAALQFMFQLPIPIAWSSIGLLVFLLKSRDRAALTLSAMAVGLGTAGSIPLWKAFAAAYPALVWIIPALAFVGNMCLWSFFFVFPNGRYQPGWTLGLAAGLSLYNIFNAYDFALPPWAVVLGNSLAPLFPAFLVAVFASLFIVPIYRYRRIATTVERQQIKWVVFAIGIAVVIFAAVAATVFVIPNSQPDRDITLVTVFIQPAGWSSISVIIPLAIAVSILRFRLFDIDLIIRRTLVYSTLTALLALLYFGGVTLLQSLITALTGQSSPAALVISTLLIAALFNPLRQRVQGFIDRGFYRQRFDAEKALARFAAITRDETDLEHLSAELRAVVQDTVQPEGTSLWLRRLQW